MVGGQHKVFRRDEQEYVSPLADDLDIGFIAGGSIVYRAFVFQVELVAVVCGGFGVVENGLVRDADFKDLLKNERGFAGRDGKGHVEGQDQTEDVLRVVNFSYVDERF